jgi:UDP-N-acetylmuramate-alanine ligase
MPVEPYPAAPLCTIRKILDVAHIEERLVSLLKARDVVAIFSNGGFDGIHGKLLEKLKL